MIRGMRRIFLIAVSLLLISAVIARHYHRVPPTGCSWDQAIAVYTFSCKFDEADSLIIRSEGRPGFLEARFSNHAAIRYEWPHGLSAIPIQLKWTDSAGRRKSLPVATVKADLASGQEFVLPLGRDYSSRVGSITERVHLDKILCSSHLSSAHLSNYPFQGSPVSGTSFLSLAAEFKLQDLEEPTTIDSAHVQTWEFICPSFDGRRLAVASMSGDLYLLESSQGKLIWKYHVPDGRLSDAAMSDDDRYVFVGEHSADGSVYCLNSETGRLVWKYSTAADIGSFRDSLPESGAWSASIKPHARDVIWRNQVLFVRARRSRISLIKGKRRKSVISKVYAFRQDNGRVKWTYPAKGSIDGYQTSTLNVSDDGQYVSLATFDSDKRANPRILVLDGETGALIWEFQCDTIKQYFKISTCYEGLAFSPDATLAAAVLNDGRIFYFDNQISAKEKRGVVLKIIPLISPIATGTVPVTTFPGKQFFTRDNSLIISTGQTHTTPLADANMPPVNHPDSNSVFVLDRNGELRWRTSSGGYPAMIDLRSGPGKEYLAVAFSQNIQTRDINNHGFALFDLTRAGGSSAKMRAFYHTDGIAVSSRLSSDLQRLFVIESVIDMDATLKQDYRGKHRMLIFNLNND